MKKLLLGLVLSYMFTTAAWAQFGTIPFGKSPFINGGEFGESYFGTGKSASGGVPAGTLQDDSNNYIKDDSNNYVGYS